MHNQGRQKVYKIGGLPKARIIKFMNFNGGICSPYSFGVRNPQTQKAGVLLHYNLSTFGIQLRGRLQTIQHHFDVSL